jgi:tetratricopeptide (TPR) repeat protein
MLKYLREHPLLVPSQFILAIAFAFASASAQVQPDLLSEARQLIKQNRYREASTVLAETAKSSPNTLGLAHEQGIVAYKLGDYLAAANHLKRAIEEDPSDKTAVQLRGLSLFYLGSPTQAIPLLEQVHSWYPIANVDATHVLTLAYIQTKDYDRARRSTAEMYSVPADSAASYLFLARTLMRQGHDPIAEEHGLKAVALDPKLPLAHYLLGEFYLYKSRIPEATKHLEAELALNPAFAGTYDRLADVYVRTERFDEAHRLLQRAILLDPNSTGPYILMGKVLLKKDDPQQALLYLERANRMDARNFITHHLMGQAYRALKNTDAAERELKIAEELQAEQAPKLR